MSKIEQIVIKNFMSIEDAVLEFDESGILNLVGYNDSGKSATTRALEVIMYDAYSTDQVNFIKDGKDFFEVGLRFSDGVYVSKIKYLDGKSEWTMTKDKQIVYSNRLDVGFASIHGVPEAIQKYLGVVEDESTGERLNVRRNTDKLFLINTTGGDNYKIINSILHSDILSEAVKRMNEDRNKLQSEVASLITSSDTLKRELDVIQVMDVSTEEYLKDLTEKLRVSKQQEDYLSSIIEQKEDIESIMVYDEITVVDTTRLSEIGNVIELQNKMDIPIYDECPQVDMTRLRELENIIQLRKEMDIVIPPELPIVVTDRLRDIRQVGETFNNLWSIGNNIANVENEHKQVTSQLELLSQQYGFKICKNCGTVAV